MQLKSRKKGLRNNYHKTLNFAPPKGSSFTGNSRAGTTGSSRTLRGKDKSAAVNKFLRSRGIPSVGNDPEGSSRFRRKF